MEDYKVYECQKCQIRKQYDVNAKVDFTCKCCGRKMKYITAIRKNSTQPYKKENYYSRINDNVSSNKPKCPTCGSTDLSKVSTRSKAGSVFMWGLFSQKVKKTWHCNNCKYEW